MPRPDEIAGEAILSWLAGKRVSQLEAWARARADLLPEVQREFGPTKRALGRMMIGPEGVRALRDLTAADADRVIDLVLRRRPEHGLVLWQHSTWARDQILQLCHWFVSSGPERVAAVR